MLALLTRPEAWIALATLSLLEIVLGIDNVIFISILVGRLARERQRSARMAGLSLAMLTRVALLFCVVWLTRLTQPWLQLGSHAVSGRDLILGAGGLFLLGKSVVEIHHTLEGGGDRRRTGAAGGFAGTVIQIALIDIVFSLDSVFTAVGLARADQVAIMVAAIVLSILAMMWMAASIGDFVERHPTIKVLALAFLILIGVALIAEAMELHIPKGYLYFAMAFAVAVEMINLRLRRAPPPRQGPLPRQGQSINDRPS
jgi:predicted tellurium resistance membrane protein TerC